MVWFLFRVGLRGRDDHPQQLGYKQATPIQFTQMRGSPRVSMENAHQLHSRSTRLSLNASQFDIRNRESAERAGSVRGGPYLSHKGAGFVMAAKKQATPFLTVG